MSSKDLRAVSLERQDSEDTVHTVSVVHASLPPRGYRRHREVSRHLLAWLAMV